MQQDFGVGRKGEWEKKGVKGRGGKGEFDPSVNISACVLRIPTFISSPSKR